MQGACRCQRAECVPSASARRVTCFHVPWPLSLPPSLQQMLCLLPGRSQRKTMSQTLDTQGTSSRDAPTRGSSAPGSGALLVLFIQVQQTHKMKVRRRCVLLRKSPLLFRKKTKTNHLCPPRDRPEAPQPGHCSEHEPGQSTQDFVSSLRKSQLRLIFLSPDLSWS